MTFNLAAIAAEFGDDGAASPLTIAYTSPLWRWKSVKSDAPASWFFVTISGAAGDAIAGWTGARGAFASIKVEARIGETVWRTSLFPSKDPPGFLLPVKAAVRRAESIAEGDDVALSLTLMPGATCGPALRR